MKRLKIMAVVGARPNFVKIASLARAFGRRAEVDFQIVHTGQHYDAALDEVFFRQLEIPPPGHHLGVGSDTPNRQIARMLSGLERVFLAELPDAVLVAGDSNSTLAGALAAVKMNIPLAHVEAGLRSGDRTMPEEINRIVTDAISDFLFVTEQAGVDHLAREGVPENKIFLTGNCMIDTLVLNREKVRDLPHARQFGLLPGKYVLATFHRPSNVDRPEGLEAMVRLLDAVSREWPVVLPLHPRTLDRLAQFGLATRLRSINNIHATDAQGYIEFLDLMTHAAIVLTDSGGIQEETTFLGIPCLTLRSTTERPVTISLGTNELLPAPDAATVLAKVRQAVSGKWKTGAVPPLWDGQAARRIADILVNKLTQSS